MIIATDDDEDDFSVISNGVSGLPKDPKIVNQPFTEGKEMHTTRVYRLPGSR